MLSLNAERKPCFLKHRKAQAIKVFLAHSPKSFIQYPTLYAPHTSACADGAKIPFSFVSMFSLSFVWAVSNKNPAQIKSCQAQIAKQPWIYFHFWEDVCLTVPYSYTKWKSMVKQGLNQVKWAAAEAQAGPSLKGAIPVCG